MVAALSRPPTRLLLIAFALLAAAWLVTPYGPTPPLYDGVAYPDEPYRYVAPPKDAPKTAAPGPASDDPKMLAGRSELAGAGSNEQLPQVQVVVAEGDITAPTGATVVHLRVRPVAPTSEPPDARIWGNVYRLTATSDKGPAQIHPAAPTTTIILRAPVGPKPRPMMEYRDGTRWRRLTITQVGNDLYSAPLVGVGDYAVATRPGQPQPVPGTLTGLSGRIDRWVLAPGIALALLIAAIVVIRWRRARARP